MLSICATLPIIWRDPGSENARAARIMETGVALSHSVLQVSQIFLHRTCMFMALASCHDYFFRAIKLLHGRIFFHGLTIYNVSLNLPCVTMDDKVQMYHETVH